MIGVDESDCHLKGAMSAEKKQKKVFTLAFITNGPEVLLGLKKRGLGEGKWNGMGGKLNKDETIVDAAVREIEEECGLIVQPCDLTEFAVIDFEFVGDPIILEVHAFRCNKYEGTVTESDEMRPTWYPIDNVPYDQMWADDAIWWEYYRQQIDKFYGYFLFEGHSKMLRYKLTDYNDRSIILKKLGDCETEDSSDLNSLITV